MEYLCQVLIKYIQMKICLFNKTYLSDIIVISFIIITTTYYYYYENYYENKTRGYSHTYIHIYTYTHITYMQYTHTHIYIIYFTLSVAVTHFHNFPILAVTHFDANLTNKLTTN